MPSRHTDSAGLLSLSREYPPSRVEACCQLANQEGLVRLKQLKSVLTSARDQLSTSPLSYPELPQNTENIRGPRASTKGIRPMTQQTLTRLRHLKLTGMADAVQQQLEQASTYEGLPIEQLSLLVEHEQLSREQRKQARLVKQAGSNSGPRCKRWTTSLHATGAVTGGKRPRKWLRRGQNLLITGPCGCGKTYLACALGCQACQQGHSTRYYRLPRLLPG